jgi:hypothetical protein
MAELDGSLEHLGVEDAAKTVPAAFFGYYHAVDVEEFVEPIAEPEKVTTVVVIRLLESQKESRYRGYNQRYARPVDQLVEPRWREQRRFPSACIVHSQQRIAIELVVKILNLKLC